MNKKSGCVFQYLLITKHNNNKSKTKTIQRKILNIEFEF
jgi:hypothetical protein